MDRLYLARQEVLRSYDADPASHERSAQVERHQRWRNCSAMSELCTDLLCQVSDVQNQTLDKVFARQTFGQTSLASCLDRGTKFSLGCKAVSKYGFMVAVSVEDVVPTAESDKFAARDAVVGVLRAIVSGVGVRLGNQYIFPEMTPIAVDYLWQ